MTITAAKRIPYSDTSIAPEMTQGKIQRMLYDYGAKAVQWTEVGDQVELKFIITDDKGRPFTVRVRPPMLVSRKRTQGKYGSLANFVNKAASFRLLWWWLKSKLEAVSYGLVTFEQEFLANIAGHLPGGEEVTVGDLLIPKLAGMDLTDLARALPAPKEKPRE